MMSWQQTDTNTSFHAFSENIIARVEKNLAKQLQANLPATVPLYNAMAYSTLSKSKRIRALFVMATGDALGVDLKTLDMPACAVELVHCFSLIHDDLPAMDNAVLRRGIASCHMAHGEATAILAGDALLTLAFELLSHDFMPGPSIDIQLKMIRTLSKALGAEGMTGGQYIDIAQKNDDFSYDELVNMHQLKTGKLIEACVKLGFLASPYLKHKTTEAAIATYAKHIGLAFQIKDDLLDHESTTQTLGKEIGQDRALDKKNFIVVVGIDKAKVVLHEHHKKAIAALDGLNEKANQLKALADFVVTRKY